MLDNVAPAAHVVSSRLPCRAVVADGVSKDAGSMVKMAGRDGAPAAPAGAAPAGEVVVPLPAVPASALGWSHRRARIAGYLGLALAMLAIAIVDGRHLIIPDPLNAASLALGLVNAAILGQGDLVAAMAG